jgi:hypothetical protein
MELDEKEPAVVRALALALIRQALTYVKSLKDDDASGHLERAIDALVSGAKPGKGPPAKAV